MKIKKGTNLFNRVDSSSLNTLITSLLIVSPLPLSNVLRCLQMSLSRNAARDGMAATLPPLRVLEFVGLKFNPFDYEVYLHDTQISVPSS